LKLKSFFTLSCLAAYLWPTSAIGLEVARDKRTINIDVSQANGHLLDWSGTDRRIKMIMLDNPENLTKKIVFNADGCTPKECNNASLLLVSARPGAGIGHGGVLRVITFDPNQKLYSYTVIITIKRGLSTDNETRFTVRAVQHPKP
jgi:hypothetical protein